MNTFSILVLVLIALLLCYTAIRLFSGVLADFKRGQNVRQAILDRMHLLPISKLLKKTDININEYVSNKPVHELDTELRNCESCAQNEACVDGLNKAGTDTEAILESCPNSTSFEEYKEIKKQ